MSADRRALARMLGPRSVRLALVSLRAGHLRDAAASLISALRCAWIALGGPPFAITEFEYRATARARARVKQRVEEGRL